MRGTAIERDPLLTL